MEERKDVRIDIIREIRDRGTLSLRNDSAAGMVYDINNWLDKVAFCDQKRKSPGALTAASHLIEVVDLQCVCSGKTMAEIRVIECGCCVVAIVLEGRRDDMILAPCSTVAKPPAEVSEEMELSSCHLS